MAKLTGSSITMQFSISEVSKLTSIRSPEVLMYGFPWQVEVKKRETGAQKVLAAFLYCTNKDCTSNWAATACATIKLLPFAADQQVIEHYIPPFNYHRLALNFGTFSLIKWDDLLTKYVDNDTIKLEVKIEAEDPNSLSRSMSKLQCIYKSCECGCQATFELAVKNVSNLMAVQSPEFIIRGMPWYIVVYKNDKQLGVFLKLLEHTGNVSCQVTMSVKLLSSNKNVGPIEKSKAGNIRYPGNLNMKNLVSWDEMLKSQNGFVNGNSITLNIEIKSDKPVGIVPAANPNGAAKANQFECSICLEGLGTKEMSVTPCGHSFCTACIDKVIRNRPACPLCNKAVQPGDLRPLFLSAAK